MVMGMLGGLSLLMCSVLVFTITRSAAEGRLPRNGTAGIRTRATTASDAAWLAGHQAALPPVKRLSGLLGVWGVGEVAAGALAGGTDPTVPVVVLFVGGVAALLIGALLIGRRASAAADDACGHEAPGQR